MALHAVDSTKRPQPLVTRASITATISGLVSLLVTLGVFPATLGKQINGLAEAVIAAVALGVATVPVIVHAFVSRSAVTPLSSPQDAAGNPLRAAEPDVPAVDVSAALSAADAVFPAATPALDALIAAVTPAKDAYGNLIHTN